MSMSNLRFHEWQLSRLHFGIPYFSFGMAGHSKMSKDEEKTAARRPASELDTAVDTYRRNKLSGRFEIILTLMLEL